MLRHTPNRSLGRRVLLLASLALACAPKDPSPVPPDAAPSVPAISATLVLEHASVVVLDPSPHVERDQSVVTDGERIVWVGLDDERPPTGDATVVDLAGRYVMPGLSDMHAHLPAEDDTPFGLQAYLDLQLAAGVTSVRSMRGDPSHAAVDAAISAGTRTGPDLFLASDPVATESLSEPDAQGVVAKAKRDGADFIKLLGVADEQSYRNLMVAAREAGIRVAGHLPSTVDAELAAELGQQSIEHLGGMIGTIDTADSDSAAGPDKAAKLAHPSVFHCPTLHWYALGLGVYVPSEFSGRAGLEMVSDETRREWDQALAQRRETLGEPSEGRTLTPIADRLEAVRLLHEAGALLVVGPDGGGPYGLPGSAVHDEMQLFAAAGLPAAAVLRAATSHAAALRGAEDEGAVKVGYIANLVVLSDDPLADIGNVSTVDTTIHRGRIAFQRAPAQ